MVRIINSAMKRLYKIVTKYLRALFFALRHFRLGFAIKKLAQISVIILAVLASAFTIFTGVLAFQNVSSFNEWFNKEFETKEYWLSAANSLSPEVNSSFFDKRLGSPVYTSSIKGLTNKTYVNEYFYTQAFVADDGTVQLFSITLRKGDFYPEIPYLRNSSNKPYLLGKTNFGDLAGGLEKPVVAAQYLPGARRGIYSEGYYFGNPGNYLYYFLSVNDAGYRGVEYGRLEGSAAKAFSFEETGLFGDCSEEVMPSPGSSRAKASVAGETVRKAREQMLGAIGNTITVTSRGGTVICEHQDFFKEQGVFILGPNLDKVRLLRDK